MKLKIGLAQNILYQFNIFCTGTKTNCTKVQIELQHIYTMLYLQVVCKMKIFNLSYLKIISNRFSWSVYLSKKMIG